MGTARPILVDAMPRRWICSVLALTIPQLAFALPQEPAVCSRYEESAGDALANGPDLIGLECLVSNENATFRLKRQGLAPSTAALAELNVRFRRGGKGEDLGELFQGWLRDHPYAPSSEVASVIALLAYDKLQNQELRSAAALQALGRANPTASAAYYAISAIESNQDHGPIQVSGASGAVARVTNSRLGLPMIQAQLGAATASALIDTGSSASFVSEELATKFGFTFFPNEVFRFDSFEGGATARVALAPPIRINDLTIENVLFLVTRESPGLILGTPVMRALGVVSWIGGGKTIALGSSAPRADCLGISGQLSQDAGWISFYPKFDNLPAPAVFDTGLPSSFLNRSPVKFYAPKTRLEAKAKYASKLERNGRTWISVVGAPKLLMGLGEGSVTLRDVPAFELDALRFEGSAGHFGIDLLQKTGVFLYDFDTMTYTALKRGHPRVSMCLGEAAKGKLN